MKQTHLWTFKDSYVHADKNRRYGRDNDDIYQDFLLMSPFCRRLTRELAYYFGYEQYFKKDAPEFRFYSDREGDIIFGAAQRLCYAMIWGKGEKRGVIKTWQENAVDNFDIIKAYKIFKDLRNKHRRVIHKYRKKIYGHKLNV